MGRGACVANAREGDGIYIGTVVTDTDTNGYMSTCICSLVRPTYVRRYRGVS